MSHSMAPLSDLLIISTSHDFLRKQCAKFLRSHTEGRMRRLKWKVKTSSSKQCIKGDKRIKKKKINKNADMSSLRKTMKAICDC